MNIEKLTAIAEAEGYVDIDALPSDVKATAIRKVATFDDFTLDNDPSGEHDFGDFNLAPRDPCAPHVSCVTKVLFTKSASFPDLVFGLRFMDGSWYCFTVEIDRGTMPITRSHIKKSSF